MKLSIVAILTVALSFLSGCGTSRNQVLSAEEQVKLRSIQTRSFDTTDKNKTIRAVIATMQDLGFVVDSADETLGTASGTKLDGYQMKLTVSVRPRGRTQMAVRANAQLGIRSVDDPEPYQNFFAALSKAMFLEANEVD